LRVGLFAPLCNNDEINLQFHCRTALQADLWLSDSDRIPSCLPPSNMPRRQRHYSILSPPSLSMTELVKTTLDHDSTDMLIDKWLEHRNFGHDAYHEWFREVRERKHAHSRKQTVAWNKGDFLPENVFCRTVDTGRLIPLDRTWTTHVYHHHSMQERKLSMLPVVFTMVCDLSRSKHLF
jgi:hypothetical protein